MIKKRIIFVDDDRKISSYLKKEFLKIEDEIEIVIVVDPSSVLAEKEIRKTFDDRQILKINEFDEKLISEIDKKFSNLLFVFVCPSRIVDLTKFSLTKLKNFVFIVESSNFRYRKIFKQFL